MRSNAATLEINRLTDLALVKARGNANDRAESAALLAKVKNLRREGTSSAENLIQYADAVVEESRAAITTTGKYTRAFHKYILGSMDSEARADLQAGSQSITYTPNGATGGYLIPATYESTLFTALAATDNLLSSDITNFTVEPTPTLRPKQLSGYALDSIVAQNISENTLQTASAWPTTLGRVLRGNIIYKLILSASIEAEQDIPEVLTKMSIACGVDLARKIGQDCVLGNGGATQPKGLLAGLNSVYTTANPGKLVLGDFTSIANAVNRVYFDSPKCAWLMSQTVYERARNAVDNSGRPLLNLENDTATILSKPVYICPSLPEVGGSISLASQIIFGDLGHFCVRLSRPTIQRALNSALSDITRGECLYIARVRADAAIFDPSSGSAPPIVISTVQA